MGFLRSLSFIFRGTKHFGKDGYLRAAKGFDNRYLSTSPCPPFPALLPSLPPPTHRTCPPNYPHPLQCNDTAADREGLHGHGGQPGFRIQDFRGGWVMGDGPAADLGVAKGVPRPLQWRSLVHMTPATTVHPHACAGAG